MSEDNVTPLRQGEALGLTDKDREDIESLSGEVDLSSLPQAPFVPILKVWREVLAPAGTQSKDRVEPAWAVRICAAYQQVEFADMYEYRDRYFAKIDELLSILLEEIKTDDKCLTWATAEEDAVENRGHYLALLHDWQVRVIDWEVDWDCGDEWSAVELAAISEVSKMFLGQQGLCAYLDQIPFEFTDADQQELAVALQAHKDSRE